MARVEMLKEMWENFKRVLLVLFIYFGSVLLTYSITTTYNVLMLTVLILGGLLNPWVLRYLIKE